MKKPLLGIAAGLALAAASLAVANEAVIRRALESKLGGARIEGIQPGPIPGLFEVRYRSAEGVQVIYTDANANHIIVGTIYEARSSRNLTEERMRKLNAIKFESLPLELAVKVQRGNGKRVLAMFSDPYCPACRQFERSLAQIDNVTVYVFMYPVIRPENAEHSRMVWCAADRAKAWLDLAAAPKPKLPDSATACDDPVDKVLKLGRSLGVNSTPTLILANGERVTGGLAAPDLALNSTLTFIDSGPALPDAAAIVSGGNYRPTAYSAVTLPGPAPAGPYATTMAAFIGDQVRGQWKLYAYDDLLSDSGEITGGALQIDTEAFPSPTLSMALPSPANQPFIRLRGTIGAGPGLISPIQGGWRVQTGTTFFDAGPLLFTPGTNVFTADLPLRQGNNNIQYRVQNVRGNSSTNGTVVIVNEFTYSFAEGATGSFFDVDLTVANPTASDAPVTFDFLPEGGGPVTVPNTVTANAPLQVSVDTIVPEAALSTVVHSTSAVPLAAERTMIWDASGYGGHGGTAVAPSTRWLFAEGSQGFFNTYVLLANDNASAADVTINFLIEGGGVVPVAVNVPAKARHTLFAGEVPALVNTSFGIDITATQPIIAERAMYLPGARLFEGGHESAGVNETARQWFLAEGATGSFFDCFVLISNPNPTAANVTLTYLLPSGATIVRAVVVAANSRFTINVETEDAQLANADVSTTVVSDVGIVVERAMYWPDLATGWREAHNSFGVTTSALRWGVADGRIGGARAFQTFVLLANPNAYPAEVEVRFLKSGLTVARSYVLNPSSRHSIYVNADVPELGEGVFGADVRVLNYQPIAVEKALYWNAGTEAFAGGTNVTATRLPPP